MALSSGGFFRPPFMIYKFQPFSSTKELGKEYNAHCSLVPHSEDWILILDYDCMILDLRAYRYMELAIARYPDTDIFGALTNRVGYRSQRLFGKMLHDDNMVWHYEQARLQADRYKEGEAVPCTQVAGFFMLFKKRYWEANKFQDAIINEEGKIFDYVFCRSANELRLIQGIYVWHTYRITSKNILNTAHLWR